MSGMLSLAPKEESSTPPMGDIQELRTMMNQARSLNSALSEEVITLLGGISERLVRLEHYVLGGQNPGATPQPLTHTLGESGTQEPNPSAPMLMPPTNDQTPDTEPPNPIPQTSASLNADNAEKSDTQEDLSLPSSFEYDARPHPTTNLELVSSTPDPRTISNADILLNEVNEKSNPVDEPHPSRVTADSLPPYSHPHRHQSGGSTRATSLHKPPLNPPEMSRSLSNRSEGPLPNSGFHKRNSFEPHLGEPSSQGGYRSDVARSKSIRSHHSSTHGSSRMSQSHDARQMIEEFDEILGSASECLYEEDFQQKLREVFTQRSSEISGIHTFFVQSSNIPPLQEMVSKLVEKGYITESLEKYKTRRRRELQSNLQIIGVENLSRSDFEAMNWETLESRMKNWMMHMQIFVRVLIPGEKMLCKKIFEGYDYLSEKCFPTIIENSWIGMIRLGRDMSSCKRSPEKVTRLLDLYDCMHRLQPYTAYLLDSEECLPFHEAIDIFLKHQSEVVKETFKEFAKLVECDGVEPQNSIVDHSGTLSNSSNQRSKFSSLMNIMKKNPQISDIGSSSKNLAVGLDISPNKPRLPLTSYVVNYVVFLCNRKEAYWDLLNLVYPDDVTNNNFLRRSATFRHLIRALIDNLKKKSRLILDESSRQIFLMNNLGYTHSKINESDAKDILGDELLKELNDMVHQHAYNLVRVVCKMFKDFLSSGDDDTASLVKRLTCFNSALEELQSKKNVHVIANRASQTFVVKNTLQNIHPAYTEFLEKYGHLITSKKKLKSLFLYRPEKVKLMITESFPLQ